jgi:class 3 adenylate cyclase
MTNPTPGAGGKTSSPGYVLIVDDEEQNRAILHDPLEAHGYEIAEAENGMAALDSIAARLPDVILLDVMMPQMDGFEVCRRLKTDSRTAHIPILMVTALSERKERLMGIAVGANDFLNKPVDIQDVTLRVGNAVYAKHLHDQLLAANEKSAQLLLNMLPKSVAERMIKGETNIADSHPDVTVLVADLVGFTRLSAHIGADQIVQLLNEIFSAFDDLTEKHGLEKIKTIGDAYMAAGGIAMPRSHHALAGAELAFAMQAEIERLNHKHDLSIHLRIGICTGPVVAGVIGRNRFAYDIWGETVNTACHLESTAAAGKIQIAEATHERLEGKYQPGPRYSVEGKGQNRLFAYSLEKPA